MFKTILAAIVAVGFSSAAFANDPHAATSNTTPAETTAPADATAGTPDKAKPATAMHHGAKMAKKGMAAKKGTTTTTPTEKTEEPKM